MDRRLDIPEGIDLEIASIIRKCWLRYLIIEYLGPILDLVDLVMNMEPSRLLLVKNIGTSKIPAGTWWGHEPT